MSYVKDRLDDSSLHKCTLNLEVKLKESRNQMKEAQDKIDQVDLDGKDNELAELENKQLIKRLTS